MYQPFAGELAAERIADLHRRAERDRLAAQLPKYERGATRRRWWKSSTAQSMRPAAT
jgi:hypothetical protein